MTTQEVAKTLKELCQKGDFETAQRELFSDDAVSTEPYATPDFDKETKGKEAIIKKGEKWNAMIEDYQGVEVSEPIVAGNSFACTMTIHATMKGRGKMDMSELCVYKVKDGKIISEEFFM